MKKIAAQASQREEKISMSFFKNQVEDLTDEVFNLLFSSYHIELF